MGNATSRCLWLVAVELEMRNPHTLSVESEGECWVLYTYIYISPTYVADFQMSTRSQLLGG